MSKEKKYFPFYYNWAEIINEYVDEDGDYETAKTLALAIIRYATKNEVMQLGDRHLQRMFEGCLTVGVDSAAASYERGKKGGRPTKLSDTEQDLIAELRAGGTSARQIAEQLGVSESTIRRSDGWNHVKTLSKFSVKSQNQEEEEEEEEEEEINEKRMEELEQEVLIDGYVEKLGDWLPDDDEAARIELIKLGYSKNEISWLLSRRG